MDRGCATYGGAGLWVDQGRVKVAGSVGFDVQELQGRTRSTRQTRSSAACTGARAHEACLNLARAVAEELVQGHLHVERGALHCAEQLEVARVDARHVLDCVACGEDVAERDVLEALGLADVVVVGDVDAS